VDAGTLNKGTAAAVLAEMWDTGSEPALIVAARGLAQVSDQDIIRQAVANVLAENSAMAQDYLSGKEKLFGALMGQVMKAMGGKANAQVVTDILKQHLEAMRSS
jgi:aspartyl-tRNA(Asn)/glutamyl-tRNA(Gln) amidotransferase subunit B